MSAKHTPGPWIFERHGIHVHIATEGLVAVACTSMVWENPEANAARIVACVNACEGLNPEAIPELIEAATQLLMNADDRGESTDDETRQDFEDWGALRLALKNVGMP